MPPYTQLLESIRAGNRAAVQATIAREVTPYLGADPAGENGWRLRVVPSVWNNWFGATMPMDPVIAETLLDALFPSAVSGVDLGGSLGMIVRNHPALYPLLPKILPHVASEFEWDQALKEAVEMGVHPALDALATPERLQANHGQIVWFAAVNAPRTDVLARLVPHVDLADVVAQHAGQRWEAWDRLAALAPAALRAQWITDHPGQFPLAEAHQRTEQRQAALQARLATPTRSRPRA